MVKREEKEAPAAEDIAETGPRRYAGIRDQLMRVEMALGVLGLHIADALEVAKNDLPTCDDPDALPRHRLVRALEAAAKVTEAAEQEISGGTFSSRDVWDALLRSVAAVAARKEGAE